MDVKITMELSRYARKFMLSQYFIATIVISSLVLPSIILNNIPFFHVDLVNEYASYIAHGEYMALVKNPLFFWWAYGSQIPVKIISLFVPVLRLYIKDEFILFTLLVKINIWLQMLVASFSILLFARELFGKNNILNIAAALAYPLTPYFLSESAMYSARTWAYALAPLVPWIIIRYYKVSSIAERQPIAIKILNILIGGVVFSITLFNPLDSILTIGFPSFMLAVAILAYILIVREKSGKALRYIFHLASSLVVALLLSLYFLYPLIHSYISWPFKETHFVTHHEEPFVKCYMPDPLEALQAINVEHKYHFTHIWPFRNILKYPSITYSITLLVLLGISMFLLGRSRRVRKDSAYFLYLLIVLVGCITLYVSMQQALFEMIRDVIPLAFYLRKPYRLLIFWNIVLSLAPAFIGFILYNDKYSNNLASFLYSGSKKRSVEKLIGLFTLIVMLTYVISAALYAYNPPMSVLADYEPIYSSYVKTWRSNVVRDLWSCLNMSETFHKDLAVAYTSGIHVFTYNYPGFTDAQDMLYWTYHYANTPAYADMLSLYGIKYVISSAKMSLSMPLVCETNGISVREAPFNNTARIYIGYPALSIAGPNILSALPYTLRILGIELSHNLSFVNTIPIVPIFANTLSSKQLNDTLSELDTIIFHNTNITDLVALLGLIHKLGTPIVNINKPEEVENARRNGWTLFEPSYYGFLAPTGMYDSVYGQITYGYYALVSTSVSKPLEKHFTINDPGTYVLMFRLGRFSPENKASLSIIISADRRAIIEHNISVNWLGFKWVLLKLNNISPTEYSIVITPYGKVYVDNIVVIMNEKLFYKYKYLVYSIAKRKQPIYLYEPSAFAENLFGKINIEKVKYSVTDSSLGVLHLTQGSYLTLSFNVMRKGDYFLLLRYKAINPAAIRVSVSINHESTFSIREVSKSVDAYSWFYNIYILRVNKSNNMLSLKIIAEHECYVDIVALIPVKILKSLYPTLSKIRAYEYYEVHIGNFKLIFHGVKWSPKGFYFDGIDDFIEVNTSSWRNIVNGSFTILIFLRPEGFPGQIFVSKDIPPKSREWSLWWARVGDSVKVFINTREGPVIINSHMKPYVNRYGLYGLMYNNTHLALIVDGKIVNVTHIESLIRQVKTPLVIGARGDKVTFFKGYVLAFMLYNRTLNQYELQYIANNPLSPIKNGLVLNVNPFLTSIRIKKYLINKSRIEWHYVMNLNIIVTGKISCSISPSIVVFVWPMRLPNEFVMKIVNKTVLPIKALYILHGYVLPYKGVHNFEIIYNPEALILISRAVSLTSWLVVIAYILLFITARYLSMLGQRRITNDK